MMHSEGAIVVATDFSLGARMASDRAARLSSELQRPLVLTHVVSHDKLAALKSWLTGGQSWGQQLLDGLRQQLEVECERLRHQFGVDAAPVLVEGRPVTSIDAQASHEQACCLVVGALGNSDVQELLLGTTTERLLRMTSHPVLTVRQPATQGYERVLVPLDFSDWSPAAVALARAMAPWATLYLAHTFTVPFEEKLRFAGVDDATIDQYRDQTREKARERLVALAEGAGLSPAGYVLRLMEGEAAPTLVQEARRHGCDLVVIGKHGRQVAEELLLGSVTKHVLAEVRCDVLVSTGRAG